MRKIVLFSVFVLTILSLIAWIFWREEYRYSLPAIKPGHISEVKGGDSVDLNGLGLPQAENLFIHFYNYDCPCSRFNIDTFKKLVRHYEEKVSFVAILPGKGISESEAAWFKSKYDLSIPVIWDSDNRITESLGVYSTPQAMIINNGKVFYSGNYNKARFCTTKNTRFAEMALEAMLKNEPPPNFPVVAEIPYGCELPGNKTRSKSILNLLMN